MGKSKSNSSNTSNTTNVSGQNAISGDNLGVAISGVNDSTINATMTDHGAVTAAVGLAETAVDEVAEFAGESLHTFASTNSENLSMLAGLAGNQATQNSKNLTAMMDLAKFKQDGGKSEMSKDNNKVLIVLAVLLILILGYVLVKKR